MQKVNNLRLEGRGIRASIPAGGILIVRPRTRPIYLSELRRYTLSSTSLTPTHSILSKSAMQASSSSSSSSLASSSAILVKQALATLRSGGATTHSSQNVGRRCRRDCGSLRAGKKSSVQLLQHKSTSWTDTDVPNPCCLDIRLFTQRSLYTSAYFL